MNTRRRIIGLAPIALLLLLLLALSGAIHTPTQQATDTLFDSVQPTGTVTLTLTPTTTVTAAPGNAISVLATPFPTQMESPLATPITDTQSVMPALEESTIQVTDIASSPLATPSATPMGTTTTPPTSTLLATETTIPKETPTVTPTAYVILIVVTDTPTPLPLVGARPLVFPTPTPTPDYVLVAAKIFDAAMMAAGWIWFLLGSLVFFATAGAIAGLWFRQQERRRFDLMDEGSLELDLDDFTPLPSVVVDDLPDNEWPDSLP